ncbi:hypothetical protein KMW28_03755 [Flammeovirga yaeyamensis]|uniref:Uncharacterized protein n=1 Tax=Flammeovirga yaeyamensis TaxID=367791 RepID=A0AAX1N5H8_9BACT|nr:hypothetical protein [Flammeovirga yaeyamensis]MBB3701237.1 hypothetical protein [Flammeovirga yaeyamensis]NMF38292.1 hypothetical protein [Flammeovirga yaeyamensis]QWG02704.1 hypothetical protein KMW28_03755 [Flammeovirga yaeyamensis]
MYKLQRIDGDHAILVSADENVPLLNHSGDPILPVAEDVAKMLLNDFKKGDMYDEDENFIPQRSYIYCNLSSLTALKLEDEEEYELDVTEVMQWDRAFRLQADGGEEYAAVKAVRDFFGEDYINLPLNYAESVEEMNDEDKLPDHIAQRIQDLVNDFNLKETMAVDMLLEHFQMTSVALVVLWVKQKISTSDFVYAMVLLTGYFDAGTSLEDIKTVKWVNNMVKKMERFGQYLASEEIY